VLSAETTTQAAVNAPHDEGAGAARARRCIATGEIRPRAELFRFVIGPAGEIVPDVAGRLPGRGLWLTPRRDIIETARAKRLFGRAARRDVAVPADLADRVEGLLSCRCIETLGLARRAGQAVSGFEKVRLWLERGEAGLLIAAIDASLEGRRKLAGLARGLPLVEALREAEIGAAFGRAGAVHAALAPGRLAERLLAESGRLRSMRGITGGIGVGKQGP